MAQPRHEWYFREWLAYFGMRQARGCEALDWPKSKVSKLVSGDQAYDRESVNALAALFNLAPYELLMAPEEAMAMRRMRTDAIRIAADTVLPYRADPVDHLTGTHG